MSFSNLILFTIISLIYLSSFKIKCYFVFPFESTFIKDKTVNQTDFFTNLFQYEPYINFKIGSNQENIRAILKMDKYGFLIYENAYSYKNSDTYEELTPDFEENLKTSWVKDCDQIGSKDIFYIPTEENKNHMIQTNKTSFLRLKQKEGKDIYFNEMYYKDAIIGLKYNSNSYFQTPEFVKELKKSKAINKNVFYLTFEKETKNGFAFNNNKGKFIVGKELDENETIYTECVNFPGELLWGLEFNNIYTKYKNEDKKLFENIKLKAQIVATSPYIETPNIFFEYLRINFFEDLLQNNICKIINFTKHDIYLDHHYYSYACDSKSNIFMEKLNNNFPKIIFEHKILKQYFNLTKNDLFAFNNFDNNDQNLYFLMITGESSSEWGLGIPFLKNYVFSYDYESKMVGYYPDFGKEKNDEGKGNFFKSVAFKVIIIVLLVIVVFALGVFFQKYYKKTRKKKANELDDEFDYEPHKDNNDKENKNNDDIKDEGKNKNNEGNESLGINE